MSDLKTTDTEGKTSIPEMEHEVLAYWDKTDAFRKSVEMRPESKRYVFYDGPPFATGLPHYGHILASAIKDVVPRYWTMRGYRVDRVWGWDCHGVPIENMIEKELGLKGGKKAIEELGIGNFNAACRSAILRFDSEWEKVIRRIGRWVDFKNSYKTMDMNFMESVWWAFKTMNDKGYVYEGRRVILYCPRCATPLSNFEIAMDNSYKDVEDNSVYVKFKLTGESASKLLSLVKGKKGTTTEISAETPVYFLAWTTTPWTLPGNVALAVQSDADYRVLYSSAHGGELFVVADTIVEKKTLPNVSDLTVYSDVFKGSAIVGFEYEPLYTYMSLEGKKAYYVTDADFVSLEDGTGIVHTAAIFGEDDYRLAVKKELPCVPTLDDQGRFLPEIQPLAGVFYKKGEQWVIDDLTARNLMWKAEKTTHSYPFCYRCETPLYFNAVPAWFIDVAKLRPDMVAQNKKINWYPGHLKEGRFGKGLETAPDWNVSRSRYWGTPMPVWVATNGEKTASGALMRRVIGSIDELKKWAIDSNRVAHVDNIHREFIDDIELWVDDAKTVKGKRIPEVFDCWIESGSMPYASIHYPFEHKELFEATHPAQFIAEYIAQTRAWFYTLHVMSVGLFGKNTFENAVTTGTILAEDGTKMSKSKKNYPDPVVVFEKYGVDSLRLYLLGSVVMKAENLNFSEDGVKDIYQRVINTLWNVFTFGNMYVAGTVVPKDVKPTHVMDRWIVSRTSSLVNAVTTAMNAYDTVTSIRVINEFVTDLSTWYVRRSRSRIKDEKIAASVLVWVLDRLVRVMAPFAPFVTERIYQNIHTDGTSVHLSDWPEETARHIDTELETQMTEVRRVVEKVHASRKAAGSPVRQPLLNVTVSGNVVALTEDLVAVVRDEINVKNVTLNRSSDDLSVILDMTLTQELIDEGRAREIIRLVQTMRKEKKSRVDDHIDLTMPETDKGLSSACLETIQKETLADTLVWGTTLDISIRSSS